MSNKNFRSGISGKGYYIALILCAVAIGISGYLYYRNADDTPSNLDVPPASSTDDKSDVQAVATQPGGDDAATTGAPTLPAKPAKTAAPVSGEAVAQYAVDCLSYNQTTRDWRTHDGIDYAAAAGTAVTAAADGSVYTVYDHETMGKTVVLQHAGGYMTVYSSLDEDVEVAAGDQVQLGQTIGYVGNSALLESAVGDHVHFSVTCNDTLVDPAHFLQQD